MCSTSFQTEQDASQWTQQPPEQIKAHQPFGSSRLVLCSACKIGFGLILAWAVGAEWGQSLPYTVLNLKVDFTCGQL